MQQEKHIQSISIVGPGKVGTHLAQALSGVGFHIKHIISRSPGKGTPLADKLNAESIGLYDAITDDPDLYLLCVKDEAIEEVADLFSGRKAIIAHTSASTGTEVFKNHDAYGVFYPLQTFTPEKDIDYGSIPFFIEGGDKDTEQALLSLAEKISGRAALLSPEGRKYLHIAAVFACNFANYMNAVAEYLLEKKGLERELLDPLVRETFEKLGEMPAAEAQTGPALREDRLTMEKHMEVLKEEPELQELYRMISKSIVEFNRKRNE